MTRGLVLHTLGEGTLAWQQAVRAATNARRELAHDTIEIVLQGPVVTQLVRQSESAHLVAAAAERGVTVLACANSLSGQGLSHDDLDTAVDVVASAVAHVAQRQWEGWAYVRL